MDTDITSTQPILSSSLTPLLSSSPLLSEKTDTPTPTPQSRLRSPTRKPSSIIVPLKPKPPRKPRKHRQPATIDAPSSQPAQSTTSPSAKEPKKPAMHVHRMLRVEVPDDAIGVQVGQLFSSYHSHCSDQSISRTLSNYMYDCFGDYLIPNNRLPYRLTMPLYCLVPGFKMRIP
jgi:hypothetical protein